MRSNGLTAASYSPVADLDPRAADALLQELKEQGVAAYTKPVETSSTVGFDRTEFRVNVQDRLYVDAAESERVKAMIAEQDPDLVAGSDDLTWAQIVAGFDQPLRGDVPPWPVTEDLDQNGDCAGSSEGPVGTDTSTPPRGRLSDVQSWLARRDATASSYDDAQDHPTAGNSHHNEAGSGAEEPFVPAPPPPLPQLEPWQQLAWIGLIGGPLLLLVAVLFSIDLPTWASLAAVSGFIGGFITLVARMDGGGSEDDPDNGAVV